MTLTDPARTTVFAAGEGGYAPIRIPSTCAHPDGTLLAFAEGRQRYSDHAENDILLKRSQDSGRTWEDLRIVASEGRDSLNDPSIVIDRRTGRLVLHYTCLAEGYHTDKAVPGYDDPRSSRNHVMFSDDVGASWSDPVEITRQVKRPDVRAAAATCGVGIQLRHGEHAGRLVHAVYQWSGERELRAYTVFSDDGGETWRRGEIAPFEGDDHTAEPQVVELSDGAVMMNARTRNHRRRVGVSHDGGRTFGEMRRDEALIERGCQGSILRYSDPADGAPNRILFSNPASEEDRVNGTIRLSLDDGATWPISRTLEPGPFAYSCLTVLPDGTIGCLFEAERCSRIDFARFTLDWLTQNANAVRP